MTRVEKILDGAAYWGAFYRENVDKFVEDYLHIRLKLFQRIVLVMMFWSTTFAFIACRGIGKTYLSAIYCVCRCVLYPGTKVCIASGTRGQAMIVLSEKIMLELVPGSPELRAEIDEKQTKINGTNAQIVFKNTSAIKVVTASDSARGNRCHVLLLDEFRLIRKDTVDTVLRKFLTLRRMPKYNELNESQRRIEYNKEKNLTMYLSSAYFKDSWAYAKCVDIQKAMTEGGRHQFVCGFPYQLSIAEGLLDPEAVADEMQEQNFSDVKFSMEMGAEFFGSADGAFFEYDSIAKNRHISYPMLPDRLSSKLNTPLLRIPSKQNGELRILSADIALMSSRKNNNDATAVFINQMRPTKAGRYVNNIIYGCSYEGLRTDDQALIIRKLFDEYSCDYIVLDASGIGLGVFDSLARDIADPDTGEIYPALSCCNNEEMARRCTSTNAAKVIWAIKASASFNSDAAFLLREGFRSGRIRLLVTEYDGEKLLGDIKGFNNLNPPEQLELMMPYYDTTLLINELVKLQHEESGGKVRVFELSDMRKDRYSSLAYNYYVATQLESKMTRRQNAGGDSNDVFIIRPPSQSGKAVSLVSGRNKDSGWY